MILALFLGCLVSTPNAPAAPPAADRALDPADFHIVDAGQARLFRDLHTHAGTGTPGWRTLPYRRLGNFVEARWCSPTVREAACAGGSVVNDREPGTGWRQLSTLAYDSEWPSCFGVVYSAGEVPAQDGWGATVWLAINGRGVVGEGYGFSFLKVEGGRVVRTISGGGWSVELGADRVTTAPGAPAEEALAMVQSPENFAATVSMRLNALVAQVRAAEAAGVGIWEEGPYLGRGIPPERTRVVAPTAEGKRLADEAAARLTADRDTMIAEAKTLHPVLARLMPKSVIAP